MSILYLDCFSGIAGDMFLAALFDAGLPLELVNGYLEQLPIPEKIKLNTRRVRKGALDANQLVITLDGVVQHEVHAHTKLDPSTAESNHEHQHDHSHTDQHEHGHHEHEHSHHEHEHEHQHVHKQELAHEHHHRNLSDILALIASIDLPPNAARMAKDIFNRLAEAEAKVHGESIETVHFHEVGAIDSIIDILGASIGLDYFNVEQVYASALPFSSGRVKTDHGMMPVPVPATLALMESAKMPLRPAPDAGELITPTGAAILAVLATFQRPAMCVEKVGVGAGNKNFDWPNILRVMIGNQESIPTQPMIQLSCNIDDMNPEFYAPVMDHLFQAGAVDVTLTPIQMKKNRPGTMIGVIAPVWLEKALAEILLRETTSFGVRIESIYRYEAQRAFKTIETPYGPVKTKQKIINGEWIGAYPEYEEVRSIAERNALPVEQVYRKILQAIENDQG